MAGVFFSIQARNAWLAGSALAKAPSLSAPVLAMSCRWSRVVRKTGSLSSSSKADLSAAAGAFWLSQVVMLVR